MNLVTHVRCFVRMDGCDALFSKTHDGSIFLLRNNTYRTPSMVRMSSSIVIRLQIRPRVDGVVYEHQTRALSVRDAVLICINTSPSDNCASFGENGG